MVVTAPAELRERLEGLSTRALVATCAALRPNNERLAEALQATKTALRSLDAASQHSARRSPSSMQLSLNWCAVRRHRRSPSWRSG